MAADREEDDVALDRQAGIGGGRFISHGAGVKVYVPEEHDPKDYLPEEPLLLPSPEEVQSGEDHEGPHDPVE